MMTASVVGGLASGLILIFLIGLCFFLARMYKNKKENSKTIATPELNDNENVSNPGITKKELNNEPTPTELITSNQGQEFTGKTRELVNDSINNKIIQNIRQEMAHNISQDPLSSFNIDENIIDQMKQDILLDIKQELKQSIRSKVMSSFLRDNNVDDSSSSKNDNK
ncbi:hypothetical protein RclHR1_02540025 [Rhizophagus clarus]|uniref:Uncharacterized protein n=1 Tax=Rhizophagus clarus TaxID=94130 RepID=A0A2Z6REW7_9GLOM|nr:hypothetical protein RclHR1_02540025 [Rhizophagus clarus]GES82037.1 hypothetical protein GLOIN_2v1762755 [Rhizophagus clarus]